MLEMLPGLVRIYEEWAERYPDVQPLTVQFAADGKRDGGLDGVLAYPLDGHWLLVTFGLTELGEKTSEEPRVSGAGFEFTCRIPREDGDETVPGWILRVLHALADHFLSGSELDVGHWITTPSPLGGEPANGDMTSLVIVSDVEIRVMDTPNGIVLFHQIVGLTSGEGADVQEAQTAAPLVALLRDRDPKLLTDPGREPSAWTSSSGSRAPWARVPRSVPGRVPPRRCPGAHVASLRPGPLSPVRATRRCPPQGDDSEPPDP